MSLKENTQHSGELQLQSKMDIRHSKFPFSIVWTPIPILTWIIPFIGHMGIAYSSGVIRDFAGPYYVSEDEMAFGKPTKYWILNPLNAEGGVEGWDRSIYEGSELYKTRVHNLCCDNCHSHVAHCLNLMKYGGKTDWNMVKLALLMIPKSKYVNFGAFIKTWLPFFIIVLTIFLISYFL